MKKFVASILVAAMLFTLLPAPGVFAKETGTVTVENEYIKVTVSRENGGYTISTLEGDILKKSDNNKALTHRGENFDTSFTSFQIDGDKGKEYIFGNDYGLFGLDSTAVVTEVDSVGITSTWSVKDLEVIQRIELVSGEASEQLGTAQISYKVKNKASKTIALKSRVLIDTQLGEKDFGYYELTKGVLGAGYNFIDKETSFKGAEVPADYFVKDSPFQPEVAAFGVNSVIAGDKPYQMTFAHWANIGATKFDYTPDDNLTFSNELNIHRTADSAAALYFDLGNLPTAGEKTFTTYYGVTANLKNKNNEVLINTTAPTKLEFNESRTAYIGSSGNSDNLIRINSIITNPAAQNKSYKELAVVVYAIGFTTQRQTDKGTWINYDNHDPLYTNIVNFDPGGNITTFFDFKFEPRDNHELGSFVTKVFNMDPKVNELGIYAEDFCLGETVNYIYIPAKDPSLPSITLHSMEPQILYNDDRRFLNVYGQGMSFFVTGLNAIELRGEKKNYSIPVDNLTIAQDAKSISILLEQYIEAGRYNLHFLWDGSQPNDIPKDFSSQSMAVQMTADESYRNDKYGVLTVQRDGSKKYKIVPYRDETAFELGDNASGNGYSPDDLIFVLRGELIKDNDKDEYRLAGKNKNITINQILNYKGNDFVVSADNSGSVEVVMDGKITTIGANTTVRNGSAKFELASGTKYIIPVYDSRGEIQTGGDLKSSEDYLELRWNSAVDTLQTIGGFLIDLKYGVLGKIQDEKNDKKTYDIISFGGGLDLSFMTPGGAKTARENKSKDASWDLSDINDKSGLNPTGGPQESERAPTTEEIYKLEAGAQVHDVLYGQNGKKIGHIGINMDAHLQLPQIVSFLPAKMAGDLSINTIGGYRVGVEGETKTATFEMGFALVIKSNPSGAPIPDKLFFSLGGFEPGINIDSAGILWITGGGGGFDNLYDTIYGFDGLPPFKLLLNVQFDIFKIMTGQADLELSLRSLGIALSDVSLKMIKNAKFLDRGSVGLTWYPNFDLSIRATVNFAEIFKGSFSLIASQELFEMMLRVALILPSLIPIVGGMEIAAAELGGGTEKMWGSVEVLSLIKVGFIYWWDSGNVEFTSGNSGASRSMEAFQMMTAPRFVGNDPVDGKAQYMSVGTNLAFIAGTVADGKLTEAHIESFKSTKPQMQTLASGAAAGPTKIIANQEQTSHLLTLGTPEGDYILTVTRADGEDLGLDFNRKIKIWNDGSEYPLNFYQTPSIVAGLEAGEALTEGEKNQIREAAAKANVNVVGKVAYIALPKDKQANPTFLIQFDDERAYEVGAVFVAPIGELKDQSAKIEEGKLKLTWASENISDKAVVSVSISDEQGDAGILLADKIKATDNGIEIVLPGTIASGLYCVTLILNDEEKCYASYQAGQVQITDIKAPTTPNGVSLTNAGSNKLRVSVADDFTKVNLEGYYVDVYEEGKLIEAGLYSSKAQMEAQEALIGGRYDVPIMEEYSDGETGTIKYRQKTDGNGAGLFQRVGYEPGKNYMVKIRAGGVEVKSDGDIYHYSSYVLSDSVEFVAATPPILNILAPGAKAIGKDGVDFALANSTNTFKLMADEPVQGTLTVDGVSGETYSFDKGWQTEWAKELTLADGLHYLEFDARDLGGDRSIYQIVISIDTTPPVIMLERPINGGIFTDNKIQIKGVADPDALYTFKVDGIIMGESDRDMSEYFTEGILEYKISLDKSNLQQGLAKRSFEIIAKDGVGNRSSKQMELIDSRVADIARVEIYSDGKPVSAKGLLLSSENTQAKLQLMGFVKTMHSAAEEVIDITDADNVSFALAAGSGINLDNRTLSANSEGQSMILASLDLGGGSFLTDGVMVATDIYAALTAAINQGRIIQKGKYTDETWLALQNAIINGENLKNTAGASKEQINEAIAKIQNAIARLVEKEDTGTGDDPGTDWEGPGGDVKTPEKEVGAQWQTPFNDVNETDWFYEDVAFVLANNLFKGTAPDQFSPNTAMTRGMLVTVLYRMNGETTENMGNNSFIDVPEDEYYTVAVKWAAANGIVKGTGENTFAPNGEITREQIMTILFRYLEYVGLEYTVNDETVIFQDENFISDYAKKAVQTLNKLGIVNGKGNGIIDPLSGATRAEVAAMIHRYVRLIKK